MTEKNLVRADFYTSIILIAFGITATRMAMQMPLADARMHSVYSSAGVVPGILGIIITVFGIILFVRSLVKSRRAAVICATEVKAFFMDSSVIRIIITITLCLLYVFFLGRMPFPLVSFLFIFIFILFFEYERNIPLKVQKKTIFTAAIVAFVSSAAITLLFQYLFLVRLP